MSLALAVVFTTSEDNEDFAQFAANLVFPVAVFVMPWLAGRMVRSRQQRAESLEDRAAALEREGEERARAAVAEERLRVARELHDVVGHCLSVIVVQAGAERRTLDPRQESARQTLVTIEETGRQALVEMRRLLDMLREKDEDVALAPLPSLSRIDALVEQVRAAGLPVEFHIEGQREPLPPGVDLSAYRIIQEALTNALKHAGPARAALTIRYGADDVEVEVADDGAPSPDKSDAGHGLTGLRERVALHGGSIHAGAREGGGYSVRVRLPLRDARP